MAFGACGKGNAVAVSDPFFCMRRTPSKVQMFDINKLTNIEFLNAYQLAERNKHIDIKLQKNCTAVSALLN